MATDYRQLAYQDAVKYGLDPRIFLAQIEQESNWNPSAVSPAGATGIAQLMPQYHNVDATDPVASLDYAAKLMAGYLKQYNGSYATSLAAYNAGPGAVAKYGGVPPFEETQRYVKRILGAGAQERGVGLAAPLLDQAPSPQGGTTMSDPTPGGTKREVWLDDGGNPVAPGTAGATRHMFYFTPDGDVYAADWQPSQEWWQKGPLDPGQSNAAGKWTEPYFVRNDAPKEPSATSQWSIQTKPNGTKVRVNELTGEVQPLEGFEAPSTPTSTPKPDPWTNPMDGSVTDLSTGRQLSPPIPNWTPGRGVPAPPAAAAPPAPRYPNVITHGNNAYKVDPYTGEVTPVYDFGQEAMTPYQEAQLAQAKEQMAQSKEASRVAALQKDQEREAANMRQLATNYTSAWNQALAFQLPEGQQYWTGFEPGGVQDQLMQRYGIKYTAPQATRVPFNPWQAAQAAKGQ